MEKVVFPDYSHSNLNFVSSLTRHFGLRSNALPLANLPVDSFQKKHLIFLILDGFGANLLSEFNLPFLQAHLINTLTSVFPSTTTSAIPSLLSGKFPLEHGALGWSLYFKELARLIAYLPAHEHITNENLNSKEYPIYKIIDFESMFSQIKAQNPDLDMHYLVPKYISKSDFTRKMGNNAPIHGVTSFPKMLKKMTKILKKAKKRTFFYCYYTQPDSLEHEYGVFSNEVKNFMENADAELEKIGKKLESFNAEMFITADHGLIDIEEYICINDYHEIYDAMLYPLFPEGRFASFFIKPHKKAIFEASMKQFFTKKLLGNGVPHPKIDDFIGDYIAIAIGRKAFRATYPNQNKQTFLKAHHCGLTASEMDVPLIRII
jgi:hypothetical protein